MVYGKLWKTFDTISLRAYIGLLLLAGVYKSNHESLKVRNQIKNNEQSKRSTNKGSAVKDTRSKM